MVGIKKRLKVFNWKAHAENGDCMLLPAFHPARTFQKDKAGEEDQDNSGTESANETESNTKKDGCLAFKKLHV